MFLSQLNVGELIKLGHYPQGANGEKLPIEWRILKALPDRVLVLSDKILDWKSFHNENGAMRWEHSSLREWLINEFAPAAFTAEEWEQVFQPEVQEDPVGDLLWSLMGMETTTDSLSDPIFLLSASDIQELFPSENSMFCPGAEAKISQWVNVQNPDIDDMSGCACWWLRSSWASHPMANIISPVASVGMSVIRSDNEQGVRPAMWIKISK